MSDRTTLLVQGATSLAPPGATLKPSSRTLHKSSHCRNVPAALTTPNGLLSRLLAHNAHNLVQTLERREPSQHVPTATCT
jgi:hypothetical protein